MHVFDGARLLEIGRLIDRDTGVLCDLFDRAGAELPAPPGRPVRLGVDPDQLMGRGQQGTQRWDGEVRRTGKDDAFGFAHGETLTWQRDLVARPECGLCVTQGAGGRSRATQIARRFCVLSPLSRASFSSFFRIRWRFKLDR